MIALEASHSIELMDTNFGMFASLSSQLVWLAPKQFCACKIAPKSLQNLVDNLLIFYLGLTSSSIAEKAATRSLASIGALATKSALIRLRPRSLRMRRAQASAGSSSPLPNFRSPGSEGWLQIKSTRINSNQINSTTYLLAPAATRPQTLAVVAQTVELVVAQTVNQVDEKLLATRTGETVRVKQGDVCVELAVWR